MGTRPRRSSYYAAPVLTQTRQQKVGFFAQDQWTISRLTLNLGVRFDYLKGSVPAMDVPAGTWVPARHFDAVDEHPELEGLDAAGGRRLRPVRQREDRDQGVRGALCGVRE